MSNIQIHLWSILSHILILLLLVFAAFFLDLGIEVSESKDEEFDKIDTKCYDNY
jgi:hypothetical protein